MTIYVHTYISSSETLSLWMRSPGTPPGWFLELLVGQLDSTWEPRWWTLRQNSSHPARMSARMRQIGCGKWVSIQEKMIVHLADRQQDTMYVLCMQVPHCQINKTIWRLHLCHVNLVLIQLSNSWIIMYHLLHTSPFPSLLTSRGTKGGLILRSSSAAQSIGLKKAWPLIWRSPMPGWQPSLRAGFFVRYCDKEGW